MRYTQSDTITTTSLAMQALLAALEHQLEHARRTASSAQRAMVARERNLAAGTVMALERILPDCTNVLAAVLVLNGWLSAAPDTDTLDATGGAK